MPYEIINIGVTKTSADISDNDLLEGQSEGGGVGSTFKIRRGDLVVNHARGDWAGTTTLPTTGGNFTAGVPALGDRWRLTNQLVIGGNVYPAGTIIEAATNTPGQTVSNWIFYAVQL